jgi:competence protein ComFC
MRVFPRQFVKRASQWFEPLLGLIYPNVCQLCELEPATKAMGYVGQTCRQEIKPIKAPFCDRCGLPFSGAITQHFECSNCKELDLAFKWSRASVVAEGPVREAIHHYKYNGQLWYEPFLVELWLQGARESVVTSGFDRLVPVPLHPWKQREREFNQSERLARAISREVGIPVDAQLLERIHHTRAQAKLDRADRIKNVQRAFQMRKGLRLNGQRILLIDDVLTTGATTSACAKALLEGGAGEVCVWTVARGL